MSTAREMHLVVVTPETTLFDEPITALQFPLFDGQAGILPGRAPMVGRLGYGEMKATLPGGDAHFFIDGGFIQVKGSVVSVLTSRAIPVHEIDAQEAEELLKDASERIPTSEAEFEAKERDQERARRMLAISSR